MDNITSKVDETINSAIKNEFDDTIVTYDNFKDNGDVQSAGTTIKKDVMSTDSKGEVVQVGDIVEYVNNSSLTGVIKSISKDIVVCWDNGKTTSVSPMLLVLHDVDNDNMQ